MKGCNLHLEKLQEVPFTLYSKSTALYTQYKVPDSALPGAEYHEKPVNTKLNIRELHLGEERGKGPLDMHAGVQSGMF